VLPTWGPAMIAEGILTTRCAVPPHIIVIDDDPTFRQMLADYLTDYDLRVTTLSSGRDIALIIARESIDLVLLDLRLARGEDGMQIARKLREESNIPIVILSARQEEGARAMGLEVGADDYLTKPCKLSELLARIRIVLRRHRSRMSEGRSRAVRPVYRIA